MSKKFLMFVPVVAASLVLAACGSDAKEATPATSPAASSETTMTTAAASTESTMSETTMPKTDDMALGDIVAVADKAGSFTTLVAAVKAAGLVETLQGPGPFTIFAPTDDAFAKLPAGLVDKLLLPANKAVLVQILTYHAVPAKVLAADVKTGEVASVEGSMLSLTAADGKVMVNDANVITADVMASNGVIHVIDAVLVPPGLDVSTL